MKKNKLFIENGIELSDEAIEKLDKYYSMISEWNYKIDITNILEEEEVYIKHFLDSLFITKSNVIREKDKIIDIGTGGGFPGIPLKLFYPRARFTLLDSLNKRIKFLDNVVEKLELNKVEPIHARAEELARQEKYREKYNVAVSRAVAELRVLLEYCLPFVRKGGYFVAMKGPNFKEELKLSKNALKILGGEIKEIIEFELPKDKGSRALIVIKKVSNTPEKYPRGQGKPRTKPLS